VELVFSEWNKRPEVKSKAHELAKSITEQKFCPFTSDSLLPLVLEKSLIDPVSIHMTPNVKDVLMLQLTEVALHSRMQLPFAGGQHWQWVAQIIKEAAEEKVKKYLEDIDDLKKKMEKTKEGSLTAESLGRKIRTREMQITMEREVQGKIVIWGVAVYDRGVYIVIYS
jgi:hypothetical protein